MPNTCDGPLKSKSEDGDNLTQFAQQSQTNKTKTSPIKLKFLNDESNLCKKCNKNFEGKIKKGIQCDHCDAWYHQPCS